VYAEGIKKRGQFFGRVLSLPPVGRRIEEREKFLSGSTLGVVNLGSLSCDERKELRVRQLKLHVHSIGDNSPALLGEGSGGELLKNASERRKGVFFCW